MRSHELDILKGIGMLLIVLGHVAHVRVVHWYVWPFHVPLFFFVSGMLHRPGTKGFWAFFGKRVKSLYVPYVFFFLLTFSYWLLIERHYRSGGHGAGFYLLGLPFGTYEGGHLFFNGVLWFLPCLFVTELLFYPIGQMKSCVEMGGQFLLASPWGNCFWHIMCSACPWVCIRH